MAENETEPEPEEQEEEDRQDNLADALSALLHGGALEFHYEDPETPTDGD